MVLVKGIYSISAELPMEDQSQSGDVLFQYPLILPKGLEEFDLSFIAAPLKELLTEIQKMIDSLKASLKL